MASYPTTTKTFTTKADGAGNTIMAAHVNDLQSEVTAIEAALLASGLAHHLLFVDATYDIGATGASRPRNLYLSGEIKSGAFNAGAVTSSGKLTAGAVNDSINATAYAVNGEASLLNLRNTNAGNAAIAGLFVGNNTTGSLLVLRAYGSGYATSGLNVADGASIIANQAGGVSFGTTHASGALRVYTGGPAQTMGLSALGVLTINNLVSGNLTSASGVITSSSDERMKDILGPLEYGLAEVLGLKPIRYHWNKASNIPTEPEYGGFGAAQVEQFMPLAVSYGKDGMRSLHDRVILGAVVNAIKAHEARLVALEAA